jgi:hypothetical protein
MNSARRCSTLIAMISMGLCVVIVGSISMAQEDATAAWKRLNVRKSQLVQIIVSGTPHDPNSPSTFEGTGIIVSAGGYIITALHTIKDDSYWQSDVAGQTSRTIVVRFVDDRGYLEVPRYPATLKKRSPEDDVALVWVKSDQPLPQVSCKQDYVPANAAVLGFTELGEFRSEQGSTQQSPVGPDRFLINAASEYGMSGGAVVDSDSTDVVGIIVEKIDPKQPGRIKTTAIAIKQALGAFDQYKIDCTTVPTVPKVDIKNSDYRDFGEILQQATSNDVLVSAAGVRISEDEYFLGGRNLVIRAEVLLVDGQATIRAYGNDELAAPGKPGDAGLPGRSSKGDGKNGGAGTPGGVGGTGGPGANGQTAGSVILDVKTVIVQGGPLRILNEGQQGGFGGQGGVGGEGGAGGKGRNRGGNTLCTNDKSPGNGGAGGRGGTGGQGGVGGRGGDGGIIQYAAAVEPEIASGNIVLSVGGGLGGQGGAGGASGPGGPGGAAGDSSHCGGGGDRGPSGPTGAGGVSGPVGDGGSTGSVRLLQP